MWAGSRVGRARPMRSACGVPSTRAAARTIARAPSPASASASASSVTSPVEPVLDRFGGGDRLGEAVLDRDRLGRDDGVERLGRRTRRLIEPLGDRAAEAADQRRPRDRGELADGVDAEAAGSSTPPAASRSAATGRGERVRLRQTRAPTLGGMRSPLHVRRVRDQRRAAAHAAPAVSATATRAVTPNRASRRTIRAAIAASPP